MKLLVFSISSSLAIAPIERLWSTSLPFVSSLTAIAVSDEMNSSSS
ncbi:MAG TPA: hypothetical protein V6D28_17250 [Leptolyngbyaceae cyanobacterium]